MGLASRALSACGLLPDLCPAPFPPPQFPPDCLSSCPTGPACTAVLYPRVRLCLAPGLVAGLGAATWPVASVLAPSPVIAIPTSHLPPPKTRLQVRLGPVCFLGVCVAFLGSRLAGVLTFCPSPRSARPQHPGGDSRLKNWTEEAGELPWTSVPSGRSPGISCPPGAP